MKLTLIYQIRHYLCPRPNLEKIQMWKIDGNHEKNHKIENMYPKQQSCRNNSLEECIFVYIAIRIECRFNKNSLLQCYSPIMCITDGRLVVFKKIFEVAHREVSLNILFFVDDTATQCFLVCLPLYDLLFYSTCLKRKKAVQRSVFFGL